MTKFLAMAVLALSFGTASASASTASPFDRKTQTCIIEQLKLQYSQFTAIEHTVGAIDGDEKTFEMQVVQRYRDGNSGHIFVIVNDGDYAKGLLRIPGLRDQPLNLSLCWAAL